MAGKPPWSEAQLKQLIAMAEVLGFQEDIDAFKEHLKYYQK